MRNLKTAAAALILGFAAAGVLASPTMAQQTPTHPGHAAHAQATPGAIGPDGMTAHRANAIRECNERANKYSQTLYGDLQFFQYWSCMEQHGEHD